MNVKMRYVTARPSKSSPKRWYWQRPGFPLTRLPNDPARRWAMVERLNKQADKEEAADPNEGTVAWCVETYRNSDQFKKLSASTQGIYERWCREFREMWGALPMTSLTRRVVVDFADTLKDHPSVRVQAIAVLSNLFAAARYHGLTVTNVCDNLRLSRGPKRHQYWLPEDEAAFLEHADDRMRRTFLLLLYTAQRPGDVLAMRRSQWNGDTIKVRQEKTRTLAEIPCHATLRAELRRENDSTMLAGWMGTPSTRYTYFNRDFKVILKAAGLEHLQARDLRRTAVVRLSEAGCTVPQIAAITGHSIETTQKIIDTYYTSTLPMARSAIRKWEAAERKRRKSLTSPAKSLTGA